MISHADALEFLSGRINYERMKSMPCSEAAMKLDRMRDLLRRLGNPQHGLPIIHVAGTKGKGSTAAMLAAVLSASGYRVGLFTSPHITRVEERIAFDGRPCSEEEFASLVDWVRPAVEAMDRNNNDNSDIGSAAVGPTYFEILTAMAFGHFARRQANAVVLEVGLGGRLDSTNVCDPCISVITSISLDHTQQLGKTLAAIATEKAGVIKPGVPVVSGVTLDEPREVIRDVAREKNCRLVELDVDFSFVYHAPKHLEREPSAAAFDFFFAEKSESSRISSHTEPSCHSEQSDDSASRSGNLHIPLAAALNNISLGLLGRHQATNAAVALAAVEELRRQGFAIPESAVRRGLAEMHWPARVEVVARRPAVVVDAAHNAASIAALLESLDDSFSAAHRFLIFATTQEKDLHGMLRLLTGRFDRIVFTRYTNSPRGVPPEELLGLADALKESAQNETAGRADGSSSPRTVMSIAPTSQDAWREVRQLASPDDLICITGSFFLASEMRDMV